MRTRAQVSLEFLLVLAAFLAFLALWVPVQIELIETTKASLQAKQLQLALADVKNAADAVCTLGNGNEKTIGITTPDATLAMENNTLSIKSTGNASRQFSLEEQTRCVLENKTINLSGKTSLTIMNEKQEVRISVK